MGEYLSGDGAVTFLVGGYHLSLAFPKVYLLSVLIYDKTNGFPVTSACE